jgi:hypothetical protein
MTTLITHCPHCSKTLTAAEAIEKWCTRCAKSVDRREDAA